MGELLLSQEHIKERKKRTQWVHPWIREKERERERERERFKGAYFSIINDLRLTNKEDFKKSI